MKVYPVAALLLLCWTVISCTGVDDQNNVIDKAWAAYKAHCPFVAKSDEEYARRKTNFAKTHAMILKRNAELGTFTMGHNPFSIMDDTELKAYLGEQD